MLLPVVAVFSASRHAGTCCSDVRAELALLRGATALAALSLAPRGANRTPEVPRRRWYHAGPHVQSAARAAEQAGRAPRQRSRCARRAPDCSGRRGAPFRRAVSA